MSMMQFDEEASRAVEAAYLTPDVVEQRRVIGEVLAAQPGERILDIGSGPGLLALELAAAVGPDGAVSGLDPSDAMLAIAARRQSPDVPVEFARGDANTLPYEDGSFDAAVSTQVYEYVADMDGALAEAYRVLKPGGRLLVLDTDWGSIVWRTAEPERMRRVLDAWDAHLVDPHLPRRLGPLLRGAGFTIAHRSAVPLLNAGYAQQTYSGGLIGFIHSYLSGRNGFTAAELDEWRRELIDQGEDFFFSLNRYVFVGVK